MARTILMGRRTKGDKQQARNQRQRQQNRAVRSRLRPLVEALERRDLLAAYTTLEDTALLVSDAGLAGATIRSGPLHGHVEFTTTGGFAYKPALNYNGPDQFTYFAATIPPTTNVPTGEVQTVAINIEPVNDAPVALGDQYVAFRNSSLTIGAPGVLTNDKDVDNDAIKAVSWTQPSHGTVTPNENGDGGFKYTPAEGYTGEDAFTYKASDGTATSAETRVSIYVKPLPDARDDYFSVAQNTVLTIPTTSVLANDVAVNNDFGLIATLEPGDENKPKHGSVIQDSTTGDFVYKPDTGYFGSDSFVYRATDATPYGNALPPAFDLARVFIYVRPVPTAVVANDDSYATLMGKPLEIGNPGVLKNDFVVYATPTDPASNTTPGTSLNQFQLTAKVVEGSGPKHGTLTLKPQGGFLYTPNPNENYVGLDTFVYTATLISTSAGGTTETNALSDTATVTINVRQLPDARDDQYSVAQNTVLTVPPKGVLTNDIGVTGHGLTAKLEEGADNGPKHGTVVLKEDGSFTYTPTLGYSGPDSFVYRATDVSPELDPATASSAANPLPPAFDLATVTIYVRPALPIVWANPDAYGTTVNTTLGIAAPGVLKNDYALYVDPIVPTPNGAPGTTPINIALTATLLTGPSHGTLILKENGSFEYVPEKNFQGADTFTYQAKVAPPAGEANPVVGSTSTDSTDPNRERHDIATVTIYVKPLPLPVAHDDYYRVLQGTTLSIAAPGVLDNDRGADGQKLTAKLDTETKHGKLELHEDGSFAYTPAAGFSGGDSFTYLAIDSNAASTPPTTATGTTNGDGTILPPRPINLATVTIYVQPAHVPVYAFDDYYKVLAGATLAVDAPGVLANDTLYPPPLPLSPSDDATTNNTLLDIRPIPIYGPLTATLLTRPSHGDLTLNADGSFKYTPDANFAGADTFTYLASAGPSDTTGTIGAATSADMPCFIDGPCPTDPDDIATVTIYVRAPEPPPGPVAVNDFYLTAENTPLGIRAPGVLANDYIRPPLPTLATNILPPNHLPLEAVLVAGPAHGVLSLNPDGSFKYNPDKDFTGVDTFTYQARLIINATDPATATDAAAGDLPISNIATVSIRVVPAIAHGDSYQTQQEATLNVPKPGVLGNDNGGSEAHPLAATLLSGPWHGNLALNTDGSFVYTPDAGYLGPDMFTYRASDGTTVGGDPATGLTTNADDHPITSNAVDVGVVKIYVTPRVGIILANNDKFAAHENTTLTIVAPGLLANDYAPVNHLVVAALGDQATHGAVVVHADGSFTYTPDADFVGEDKFTYTASFATASGAVGDGTSAGSATATVIIHVLATESPPPTFLPGQNQRTTDESGPQKIAEWATVVSVGSDGKLATFTVTTDNPRLFAAPPTIDPTGQLIYTPAPNVSGDATVTVTLDDGSGDTTSHTFTIHIDKPHPLYNTALPCDVTADHVIAPDDALRVINYLNAHNSGASAGAPEGEASDGSYYDVNKDGDIAPIDALMVINAINAGQTGGEGEGAAAMDPSLLALVAQDAAEATLGRKRQA